MLVMLKCSVADGAMMAIR